MPQAIRNNLLWETSVIIRNTSGSISQNVRKHAGNFPFNSFTTLIARYDPCSEI